MDENTQRPLYPQIPMINNESLPSANINLGNIPHSNSNPGLSNVFPDFQSNLGIANPLAQSAFTHLGQQVFGNTTQLVNSQYNKSFSTLKYYFNVNNSYVVNKVKLLLFPLRHVYWRRRIQKVIDGEVYLPPRDDINAPDLYIPTMAFVTYVLILGYMWGAAYKFTPEVLGTTASRGLFALTIEVCLIKMVFYLLNIGSLPFLDIAAYCGYKFVGIVVTIIGGFIFGSYGFYVLLVTTSLFMAIFMVKALRGVIPELGGFGGSGSSDKLRKYFLLSIGLLQPLFAYYLAYEMQF